MGSERKDNDGDDDVELLRQWDKERRKEGEKILPCLDLRI